MKNSRPRDSRVRHARFPTITTLNMKPHDRFSSSQLIFTADLCSASYWQSNESCGTCRTNICDPFLALRQTLSCGRVCEIIKREPRLQLNKVRPVCAGSQLSPHNGRLGARSFFTFVWLRSSWHRHMAAKDYEGTATATVSNFQRYYYFNPLSPRQGAIPSYPPRIAKIFSIAVISIAKVPLLTSHNPSHTAYPHSDFEKWDKFWMWCTRCKRSNRFHRLMCKETQEEMFHVGRTLLFWD